jgi:hypothetical protein
MEHAIDRRTRPRALKPRDGALRIRTTIESCQPGARIHAACVGPFDTSYGQTEVASGLGAGRSRFRVEIEADSKLFHIEWKDDDSLVLRRFDRGPWEGNFLRRCPALREVG